MTDSTNTTDLLKKAEHACREAAGATLSVYSEIERLRTLVAALATARYVRSYVKREHSRAAHTVWCVGTDAGTEVVLTESQAKLIEECIERRAKVSA